MQEDIRLKKNILFLQFWFSTGDGEKRGGHGAAAGSVGRPQVLIYTTGQTVLSNGDDYLSS